MLFADFEKAFDSLDHNFIIRSLESFNFGDSLKQWIKTFYQDMKACVTNNGYLSDFFKIGRGVRQGCPLSPYLFIITIEILSLTVRKSPNVTGITLSREEIKSSLFADDADDASFFINGSEKSFSSLINILEEFSAFSGLRLNIGKTTVLRIGTLRNTEKIYCKMKGFKWTSDQATTLGITFSNNKSKCFELNFKKKIEEVYACLERWRRHKQITLIGKITVIKTFAIPKIIFPLRVLETPPETVVQKINKDIFSFLWDGKPDKIARNTIVKTYNNGGLKCLI